MQIGRALAADASVKNRSFATVAIGGIVSSTLLTLPALYRLAQGARRRVA